MNWEPLWPWTPRTFWTWELLKSVFWILVFYFKNIDRDEKIQKNMIYIFKIIRWYHFSNPQWDINYRLLPRCSLAICKPLWAIANLCSHARFFTKSLMLYDLLVLSIQVRSDTFQRKFPWDEFISRWFCTSNSTFGWTSSARSQCRLMVAL